MSGKGLISVAHYCLRDPLLARRSGRGAAYFTGTIKCLASGGGSSAEGIMSGPVYTTLALQMN